jgi:hypothetical protein
MTATLKVCLWKRATPKRINPNIMNSTLTGPTDGTFNVAADEISGINRSKPISSILFDPVKSDLNKLVSINQFLILYQIFCEPDYELLMSGNFYCQNR